MKLEVDEIFLKKYKTILITISLIIFLIVVVALINNYWSKNEMQFIEFGLLGTNKQVDNYFAYENSTVLVNSKVNWYLYLHNHMPDFQDVIIKVKLLNASMELPDDQKHEPISVDSFTEIQISLHENETIFAPFSWIITESYSHDDLITLNDLIVNNKPVEINVSTHKNSFFRMAFELWIYDASSQEYKFEYISGDNLSSSSLYIGFRVLT